MSKIFSFQLILSLVSGLFVIIVMIASSWPDDYLHLVMCDVGQGDAMLVSVYTTQILIDTGPDNFQAVRCLDEYLPFWDRQIELMILTHADADHIGGTQSVLNRYSVAEIVFNQIDIESQLVGKLVDEIHTQQIRQSYGFAGRKISLLVKKQVVEVSLMWPEVDDSKRWQKLPQNPETNYTQTKTTVSGSKNDNNSQSISGIVEWGKLSIVFTGDIDIDSELAITQNSLPVDTDLIKVSHHGSNTSTSQEFISHYQPETAIIGVGKNNQFGHPHSRVIDTLRSQNIKILRTDELGDIKISSDGQRYWIEK